MQSGGGALVEALHFHLSQRSTGEIRAKWAGCKWTVIFSPLGYLNHFWATPCFRLSTRRPQTTVGQTTDRSEIISWAWRTGRDQDRSMDSDKFAVLGSWTSGWMKYVWMGKKNNDWEWRWNKESEDEEWMSCQVMARIQTGDSAEPNNRVSDGMCTHFDRKGIVLCVSTQLRQLMNSHSGKKVLDFAISRSGRIPPSDLMRQGLSCSLEKTSISK